MCSDSSSHRYNQCFETSTKLNWESLLNNDRLYKNDSLDNFGRSSFEIDFDKIVFSLSLRRLADKTQVHPRTYLNIGHIHNRLTHSLEVSSVGRSLGWLLGNYLQEQKVLPENKSINDIACIVQSASLAHDIGNPPFGHTGERIIRNFFAKKDELLKSLKSNECDDFLIFEGNAQSFRLLTKLEYRPYQGGMRITNASLGAMVKYPWSASYAKANNLEKCNFFSTEINIANDVFKSLRLPLYHDKDNKYNTSYENIRWMKHPLSYLMEAADDICYGILDLEDGVSLGKIDFYKVKKLFENIIDFHNATVPKIYNSTQIQKLSILRGRVVHLLIHKAFNVFENNYTSILNGDFNTSLLTYDSAPLLTQAKKMARDIIYNKKHEKQIENLSARAMNKWLDKLINMAKDAHDSGKTELFTEKMKSMNLNFWLPPAKEASLYEWYLHALDNMSAMTDSEILSIID